MAPSSADSITQTRRISQSETSVTTISDVVNIIRGDQNVTSPGAGFTKPCALLKLDFLTSGYKKCMR